MTTPIVRPTLAIKAALLLSAMAAAASIVSLLIVTGFLDVGLSASPHFDARVRQYLLENPAVLLEVAERLDETRATEEVDEIASLIAENREELLTAPASPILGNPNGDVTVVEFFDYNCPYCRSAAPVLAEAMQADPQVRVVMKEFPILGAGSTFAAKAALAANAQGKYDDLHRALMAYKGAIDESSTLEIAASLGLDVERLKRDMEAPSVSTEIQRNVRLAGDLRINGTPSFVIGREVARGYIDLLKMQEMVASARGVPGG